jgi:hypothetical protein
MKSYAKKGIGAIALIAIICFFQTKPDAMAADTTADVVMFSFDRPLQLYALLESIEKYVKGISEEHVIYRSSNDKFEQGYAIVKARFPKVIFHRQGDNPRADFKPLTLKASFQCPAQYILFAVDDIVVKDTVDITECIKAMEQYDAYGFFLRLGKDLSECYSMNQKQPLPPFQEQGGVMIWQFNTGKWDWLYPNTVDMTLYRKKDIKADLEYMNFHAPNTLEGQWTYKIRHVQHRKGVCFSKTKIVNLPLNKVQNTFPQNRAMSEYSTNDLLNCFLKGKKMDIAPLHLVQNKAAHMEYTPTFINR